MNEISESSLGVKYFVFRFSEIIMLYSLIKKQKQKQKQKCDIPYFLDGRLFKICLKGEELQERKGSA